MALVGYPLDFHDFSLGNDHIPSLQRSQRVKTPENGWLEYNLFGVRPIFRGELLVGRSVLSPTKRQPGTCEELRIFVGFPTFGRCDRYLEGNIISHYFFLYLLDKDPLNVGEDYSNDYTVQYMV